MRSQPSVWGDVITKLKKGETVSVLEDITVKAAKGQRGRVGSHRSAEQHTRLGRRPTHFHQQDRAGGKTECP